MSYTNNPLGNGVKLRKKLKVTLVITHLPNHSRYELNTSVRMQVVSNIFLYFFFVVVGKPVENDRLRLVIAGETF